MRKLIGIVSLLLTVALLVMMAGTPSVASAQAGGDPSVTMSLLSTTAQVRIDSPLSVKATFSAPVSGFTLTDIAVSNGAAGNFAGSDGDSIYTFDVTPDNVGTVTVEIAAGAAQDPGGDGNTAAPLLSLGIPYDDNGDGEISKSEAIASIRDYFDDHVVKAHVIGVIRLYFASTGPSPPVSMTLAAEEGHTVEHRSGAQIEIPPGATAETTTITVSEVDPPESHVDVGKVFDFSIVDATGEEAELQQPVTITLPYHLPKGKTASDVVVLHWDEDLGRWESLDGEAVDEAGQTVSVDTSDLSFLAVAYLLSLTEFVRAGAEALVGGLLEEDYRKGNKHLAGFNGSLGIPPFFKVGASVVFDIDDWLRITAEGLAGYVTSWLNLHGSLGVVSTDQVLPVGISFFAHDRKGSGEDDPRFKPELSALNAEAFVVSGGLKVKKGKIDPAVNLMACSNCLGVSAIDASLNALKGELNLEIHEDIGEDLFAGVEDLNSQVSAGSVASELIGSIWDINVNVAETVVKESFAPFTSYDDPSPDDVDGLIREYYNQFYSVEGGSDITGDGRGDMVFPPEEDADGSPVASIPLVTLFKTDLRETKPYFVEVGDVSDGWRVQLPNGRTQSNSVELPPMLNAQVTWHVGSTYDAPDPGRATFRLVKDGVGPLASLLDEIVVSLPKHRDVSDLTVRASGNPGSVAPGETVTFTVSVTNDGADRAEETALTVGGLSQTGLALRSARTDVTSQHCDASVSGDFLTCVLGDMDDGETLTLTLEFEVVFEPLEPITATLGFHAASQVYDPAPENNSAEVTTTVQPAPPETTPLDPLTCFRGVFCLTSNQVAPAQATSAIREEFGTDWRVADWNDVRGIWDLVSLYKNSPFENGFIESSEASHVTRNGEAQSAPGLWYLIQDQNGVVPSGFPVHDQLGNHELTLGSRSGVTWTILSVHSGFSAAIWQDDVLRPRLRPGTLPSGGGRIEVHTATHEAHGRRVPAPTMSISGPGLSESKVSRQCAAAHHRTYYSRCWSTIFEVPANDSSTDRTYVITISSERIPADLTGELIIPAPDSPAQSS